MELASLRKPTLASFESVAAAAESLMNSGQRPSVRAVIQALGGGSPNTILPHLQTWKSSRHVGKTNGASIDPRITGILAEQINAAVADATRAAEERVSDLEADAIALAGAGKQAEERADLLASDLARIQSENQQLTGRLTVLVEEREAAEQVRQALVRAELRLESLPSLETQLSELRNQLDVERRALAEAEKAQAIAQAERDAALRQAEDARTKSLEATERETQLRREVAELRIAHERTFETLAGSVSSIFGTSDEAAQLRSKKVTPGTRTGKRNNLKEVPTQDLLTAFAENQTGNDE